ncbi:hypothetical protein GCM10009801_44710 [Streptomyces albiaxialis]|uniref:Uncharacterized protein n=1 Tax=Streptomyces albiaxialis TaxID=329523 RepID=A0ABN2W4Y8_9ACTN
MRRSTFVSGDPGLAIPGHLDPDAMVRFLADSARHSCWHEWLNAACLALPAPTGLSAFGPGMTPPYFMIWGVVSPGPEAPVDRCSIRLLTCAADTLT